MSLDLAEMPADRAVNLFYSFLIDDLVGFEMPRIKARETIDDFIREQASLLEISRISASAQRSHNWGLEDQHVAAARAATSMFPHAAPVNPGG
jgi:hypothetical protein